MKKNVPPRGSAGFARQLLKIFLVMKFAIVFILFTAFQVQAAGVLGQTVNMRARQTEIKKILNAIEKKAEVRFLYNYELESLKKKVDFTANNLPLCTALDQLFNNTGLTYKILDNNLVVVLSAAIANDKQIAQVTGKVTGDNNEPLIGVSIFIKGTKKGTSTGSTGEFAISADINAVLVISYVGYETREVPVKGQHVINVILTAISKQLEQVVVIGYGSQQRKEITSAISTVSTKDISSRPIVSAAEVLAGKSSGVQVVQPSGKPGSDFSIRIRGIASPNGNEPLYVIDGVMAYDTKALDPANIESISILKDAAAAGIYGAAGSTNGVVLITTKKGVKGKSQVEVNAYTGIQGIVKKLPMLNGPQLIDLLNEEKANAGQPPLTIPSALQGVNNNWQDIIYRDAPMSGANVGFSGGSDKGTYYLGLGYVNQEGIIEQSNYTRYSVNLNLEQNMNKWLSVGSHLGYNRTNSRDVPDNSRINQGGVVLGALSTPSFVPKYNADGTFGLNPFQAWENPLASIEGPYNKIINNNILGDVHAEIKLPFTIKYRSQLGITMNNYNYDYFLDPYRTQYGRSKKGVGQNNNGETFRYIWDNTLTYDKHFGKHSINVVAGTSASNQKETYGYEYGEGFPGTTSMTLNFASANRSLSTTKQEWSLASYFGRVNYTFDQKYLLSASFRRDGSSRFGPNNRWGNFPTVSGAWRISKEDFMKEVKLINDLKLRAGWGITGNIPPVYYPSYAKLSGGSNYIFGTGNPIPGVAPSNEIGNPNLKWEQGKQFNAGFDVSVLNGRINLTADYYIKRTQDLIYQQNVPMTTGLGFRWANVNGIVENKGFEFSVTGNVINKKEFTWASTLNMSFNNNVVENLDSNNIIYGGGIPERDNVTIVKNGLPIGNFWGYIADGVDPATGKEKFRDINKDGVIDTKDRTNIGSPLPKLTYGFINEFTYKNVSLNILIDGTYGNKVFNATRIETEGMFQVNNASADALNRWKKPGDKTNVPQAIFADPDQNSRISSRFVEDGSFLRFRTITMGYNLKDKWVGSMGISGLRLYVTLQNMFIISNYKGYQPEVNRDGQNAISQGIDYGTYPQAKTVTFGMNLIL